MREVADPLRVLVVTPLGQHGPGGIDRIMDGLRDELAAHPPKGLSVRFAATRGQRHILWSAVLVGRLVLGLTTRLLGSGPDVAHVNLSLKGSTLRKIVVTRALQLFGIPYVLHLHGAAYDVYYRRCPAWLRGQIRVMFVKAARVVVLGRFWRDVVTEIAPETADRITIIPNATRAAAPADTSSETVTVLFLGEVGPRKGVPDLVEALGSLGGRGAWRAVVAGNGDVEGTRRDIARRGLADRVDVCGWVGPAEVQRLLQTSDILVLPSFEENLPMSVIEGMAHGLAVVATPVGSVEEIVTDGRTGLLIPPGDASALAAAIGRLIADPTLRKRLGAEARAFHADHLEIGGFMERLVALWREVGARPESDMSGADRSRPRPLADGGPHDRAAARRQTSLSERPTCR